MAWKGPPRTRKSSLTLAAFRPWGSWASYRRTGGCPESRTAATHRPKRPRFHHASPRPVTSPAEDSPSGLWRSLGKRVGLTALRGSNPLSSAALTSEDTGSGSTSRARRLVSSAVAVLLGGKTALFGLQIGEEQIAAAAAGCRSRSAGEVVDDRCGDFGRGCRSSDIAGADPVAGGVLDGALDGFGLVEETEVLEH